MLPREVIHTDSGDYKRLACVFRGYQKVKIWATLQMSFVYSWHLRIKFVTIALHVAGHQACSHLAEGLGPEQCVRYRGQGQQDEGLQASHEVHQPLTEVLDAGCLMYTSQCNQASTACLDFLHSQ